MAEITVKTNHQPRNLLSWDELTSKEQKEFDYLDTDDKRQCANFIRYRNWVYDLDEFMTVPDDLIAWHGYKSDTYFSGIVLKWPVANDHDKVIMGTFYS